MNGDFEEVDREMMAALKGMRDQKMPEGLLKDFSAGVERKILERKIRPAGSGAGWVGVFVFCFAFLIFGVVLWKLFPVSKPQVIPVPVTVTMTASVPGASKPEGGIPGKIKMPLNEAEITSEIEALRELGVWTEEDEEKLGIVMEETLSELELAFEDNTQIAPQAIAAG